MSKDQETKQRKGFFGDGETARDIEGSLKTMAGVAPIAFLVGYLTRHWGAEASSEHGKSKSKIEHLLSVDVQPPRKEAGTLVTKGLGVVGPVGTAVLMLAAGMKTADRQRIDRERARVAKRLSKAEAEYNKVFREKLYPGTADEPAAKEANLSEGAAMVDKVLGMVPGVGAAALFSTVLAALAFTSGKRWADGNDPQRRRAKEMSKALENRAIHRWVPKLTIDDPATLAEIKKEHAERTGLAQEQ